MKFNTLLYVAISFECFNTVYRAEIFELKLTGWSHTGISFVDLFSKFQSKINLKIIQETFKEILAYNNE